MITMKTDFRNSGSVSCPVLKAIPMAPLFNELLMMTGKCEIRRTLLKGNSPGITATDTNLWNSVAVVNEFVFLHLTKVLVLSIF